MARIEAAITPRTQAILPVSLFGQMPDYAALNAIAARHGLAVIEDAAQSFGATQHGRRSGGVTTIGSTSFFPVKPLGCYGDGGALFTDDDGLAEKMRAIRTHGGMRRHLAQVASTDRLSATDLRQAVTQALSGGGELMMTIAEQWEQQGLEKEGGGGLGRRAVRLQPSTLNPQPSTFKPMTATFEQPVEAAPTWARQAPPDRGGRRP